MDRRDFIKSSFAVSAHPLVLGLPPFSYPAQRLEGNLRIAVVGCGSWGRAVIEGIPTIPGLESIELCEIQPAKLAKSVSYLSAQNQAQVRAHRNVVSMFQSCRPHVTLIATPDHLRAEHAILALRHGSHVLTGESAGLSSSENNRVLEAAMRARREVQLPLPLRRDSPNDSALSFLKKGLAGEISEVKAYSYSSGSHSMPPSTESVVSSDVHDKWSGAIPLLPQDISLMDGGWRNSETHSLGVIGRHGIPLLDFVMQWAGGVPDVIHAMGGTTRNLMPSWAGGERPVCPDYLMAHFRFQACPVTWEHRHISGSGPWCRNSGIYFHGSRGLFHLSGDGSWAFTPAGASAATVHKMPCSAMADTGSLVLQNFIQRLRNGNTAYPDLEAGNRSALLPMLALRSLAKGGPVRWES